MKKVRKLVALTIAASVTLSSAMPVFAMNAPGRFATGTPMVTAVTLPAEAPQEAVVTFPNLAHSSRSFFDQNRIHRGYVPVLTHSNFADLNAEMLRNTQRASREATDFGGTGRGTPTFDGLWSDFTVEDHGRFAVVTQTIRFGGATSLVNPRRLENQVFVYFIDKSNNSLSDEVAFNAYLAELEAAAEEALDAIEIEEPEVVDSVEEVAAEVVDSVEEAAEDQAAELSDDLTLEYLFPVDLAAEVGFDVYFDEEENLVEFYFEEELLAILFIGENIVYAFDGEEWLEFELSSEVFIDGGVIFAPIDFFTQILGIDLEHEVE